jgi:hypothetical protein
METVLLKIVESSMAVGVSLLLLFVFGRVIRQDFKDAHNDLVALLKDNHERMSSLDKSVEQMATLTTELGKMMLYFEKERARQKGYEEAMQDRGDA